MLPEMRAYADKLVLDVANIQYIAAAVGKRALDRTLPGLGWTVRQLLGHIALALEAKPAAIDALLAEDGAAPFAAVDIDARNAEHARVTAKMPLPEILERLSRSRDAMIARVGTLGTADLDRPVAGKGTLRDAMKPWLRHCEQHGLDLVDGVSGLRMDPMLLNWILYADFAHDPALFERQRKLATDARAHYGERLPEPDDDE